MPASFMNRFNKVYVEGAEWEEVVEIVEGRVIGRTEMERVRDSTGCQGLSQYIQLAMICKHKREFKEAV